MALPQPLSLIDMIIMILTACREYLDSGLWTGFSHNLSDNCSRVTTSIILNLLIISVINDSIFRLS